MNLDINSVLAAQSLLNGVADKTPLVPSNFLSNILKNELLLKLENMQPTGAFKIRGAINAVYNLPKDTRVVTCCSTGNHGRGIAYAAKLKGIKAVIFMSSLVPQVKIEAIQSLGAEVILCGEDQTDSELACRQSVRENGYVEVSPFDDPYVIAGQGTIGLELLSQRPDINSIVLPLSGGGLAAGIALAVKEKKPKIRVFGVTMENGAAMHISIKNGKPTEVSEVPSLADALGGGIGLNNKFTFPLCQKLIDDTFTVSENEIYHAMQTLYYEDRIIAEGSCVVGIAAILAKKIRNLNGPIATVLTGRNVNMSMYTDIINGSDIKLGESILSGSRYKQYKE
ncbi:MAG: threonine/serine dehydratase [Paracoccaceae bacterium]|nr:threonine/serine dehydratase [Paracoccaceae bacterium]